MGAWKKVPPLKRLTDSTEFSPTMPKGNPPTPIWASAVGDSDALDPHYKADISETCPSLSMVAQESVLLLPAALQKNSCLGSLWLACE